MWKAKLPKLGEPATNVPQMRPEIKKVTTLINKALTSTSLKEKNDILQEMRVLWIPQNEELEEINAQNAEKQAELNMYTNRKNEIQRQMDTLKENTSFYNHAEKVRMRRGESALQRSILATEAEISKISHLNQPQKLSHLQESLSDNNDRMLFTLIDLNLSRLEEIAHAYKKRLLVVEQSQESTDLILQEFGSVNGLIEKEKELESENEILKNDEKSYINDAFTRRRKFASMSPSVSRQMATVFKTSIESERVALETYRSDDFEIPEVSEGKISFEKVCNDAGFSTEPTDFDPSEFSILSEELAESMAAAQTNRDRLSVFENLIHVMESNNEKLSAEIRQCRERKHHHLDGSQTRIEKLNEENDRLLHRIQIAQDALEQRNADSTAIARDVLTAIKFRGSFRQRLVDLTAQYRDLSAAHVALTNTLNHNKAALRTLYSAVSAAGYELLNIEKMNDSPLKNMFASQISEECSCLMEQEPPPPKPEEVKPVSPPPEEPPSMFSLQRGKKPKRRVHRSQEHKEVEKQDAEASATEAESDKSNANNTRKLLQDASRAELLNGLSLASDLAGFVVGTDRRYYKTVHSALNDLFDEFRNGSMGLVDDFGKGLSENVSRIRMCANAILVKQKESIAIQSEALPRTDEDVQTDDPALLKQPRKK